MNFEGNIVDIHKNEIYPAKILVVKGKIQDIVKVEDNFENFILPGLIDAHVHIESSMVTPEAFAQVAVKHGTIAVVSDPHEIANVLGIDGVVYMIENAHLSPMKFLFGAPSCVPATSFESSGARINSDQIKKLLKRPEIGFLSEMMNYPGVIFNDPEVMEKLSIARENNLPIDGHAPGLRGENLKKYTECGITTDHECSDMEEAIEKIHNGMHILIREGSAAKNFEPLIGLLNKYPERVMFCTDDLHPDDLLNGHINRLVKSALEKGFDLFDVLKAASLNPAKHYNLDVGLLKEGDPADFIVIDSLENFQIQQTIIEGNVVYDKHNKISGSFSAKSINRFRTAEISIESIKIPAEKGNIKVIEAVDGKLLTNKLIVKPCVKNNELVSDSENDILKLVVLNRYKEANPAIAFIKGFGLKEGALVSSIAHDSHNIVCVGVEDKSIKEAINWIIKQKGGIGIHTGSEIIGLDLPVAGMMSDKSVEYTGKKYAALNEAAKKLGSDLKAPFMTLAFMSLLVIPELKLSDKGLFDCRTFNFTSLFER